MIARLLICPSLNRRKEEFVKTLASHIGSGNVNHPDILYFQAEEKLGIAEARRIKEHFSLKPYSAKGRAVVLEDASVLTMEAQNSLLKTIEELPREAVLILGATSDANLLPTILSRCQITRLENPTCRLTPTPDVGYIEKLISSNTEERFAFIEKLKNKEEFLHALAEYFHQHLLDYPKFATELLQAEKWAKQNVNIRAILEYLMLVMPSKIC